MLQTSIFVQYNITGSQQSEGVGWCWMDIWVIFCKYYYRNAELCFQLFIIECSVPFQLFKCWNALVNYSSYLANCFALHCTPVSQEICTFSVNTYQRLLLILDQKYSYSETKWTKQLTPLKRFAVFIFQRASTYWLGKIFEMFSQRLPCWVNSLTVSNQKAGRAKYPALLRNWQMARSEKGKYLSVCVQWLNTQVVSIRGTLSCWLLAPATGSQREGNRRREIHEEEPAGGEQPPVVTTPVTSFTSLNYQQPAPKVFLLCGWSQTVV